MTTLSRSRIRIAADAFNYDNFTDLLRSELDGFVPKFRTGDDVQFEIALFDQGELMTDFSRISSLHLEIKPLGSEDPVAFSDEDYEDYDLRGPSSEVVPLRSKTLGAAAFNTALTLGEWEAQGADDAHAVIVLSTAEAQLAPGDRWLTLAVTTTDTPAQTRTLAAGRIRILGGGRSSSGSPPPIPSESFYSATQSDGRYLQQAGNLADLADPAQARQHLGLGGLAGVDLINESDLASESTTRPPSQHSVKAYADEIRTQSAHLANGRAARHGVYFDRSGIATAQPALIRTQASVGAYGHRQFTASVFCRFDSDTPPANMNLMSIAHSPTVQVGSEQIPILYVNGSGQLQSVLDTFATWWAIPAPLDGGWHHYAVSFDGAQASLYLDGERVAGPFAVNTPRTPTGPVLLGAHPQTTSLGLGGALSDFGLFNEVLDAARIREVYRHGVHAAGRSSTGWGSTVPLTGGTLQVGQRYRIDHFSPGDDFSTVGANANTVGEIFAATATTPASWNGGSELTALGCVVSLPLDEGIGWQLHDDSPNRMDALATASYVSHLRPQSQGLLRGTGLDASISAASLGDATRSLLPTGAVVDRVLARNRDGVAIAAGTLEVLLTDGTTSQPLATNEVGIPSGHALAMAPNAAQSPQLRRIEVPSNGHPGKADLDLCVYYQAMLE